MKKVEMDRVSGSVSVMCDLTIGLPDCAVMSAPETRAASCQPEKLCNPVTETSGTEKFSNMA